MKILTLVSLLGVLVIGITVAAVRMSRLRSVGAAVSSDRLSELESAVAQLSREVTMLQASQQALARMTWPQLAAVPVAPVAAEGKAMPPSATEEKDTASTQPSLQGGAEPIATIFEREAPDAVWANEARGTLLETYRAKEFAGSHVDAECKSTLCRMTFSFDSRQEAELALTTIAVGAPWQGMSSGMFEAETGRVVYYLARPGQKLPLAVAASPSSTN